MDYKQKILSAILGVAVGDAVGVPVEFIPYNQMVKHPVTQMLGGNNTTHRQPVGTWSDDTSMTLALMDALSKCSCSPNYGLIMENFKKWLYNGEYSPFGEVFDVGGTCSLAIDNYVNDYAIPEKCGPNGNYDCGNGALMRIIPALFWLINRYGLDFINNPEALIEIEKFTSLTHGHERCIIANEFYLSIAGKLLEGVHKVEACTTGRRRVCALHINDARFGKYMEEFSMINDAKNIKSSGYVIDTLNASLWAFLTSHDYKDCILRAVNLGEDTDTTAAIAGGLAGIYYGIGGEKGIPLKWIEQLVKHDYIEDLCYSFADRLEG